MASDYQDETDEPESQLEIDTETPDDEYLELDGDVPLPEEESLIYDEDSLNLAVDFAAHPDGKAALKKLGHKVVDDFDTDWEGSAQWRERCAENELLFVGDLPKKDYPYQGAANVHSPIMLENLTRVWFRMNGELFADLSNVFGVSSLGPADDEMANLLSAHGNWQLRNEIPDFYRQMFRCTLAYLKMGDCTMHSHYDEVLKRNCHEYLSPDEFVVPYMFNTTDPNYADAPHLTRVLLKYRHDIQQMKGIWYDVDCVLKPGDDPTFDDDPQMPMADTMARSSGIDRPVDAEAPRKILWYEGWMDLPNQDRQRYVQAIVDHATAHVFQLTIHEEADWQDKAKYKRQVDELAKFRSEQAAHAAALQNQQIAYEQVGQAVGSGAAGPDQATQALQVIQAQTPMPPTAPPWMLDPEDPQEAPKQPSKKPINLFTHAVCIEPAAGALGIGYGNMQADFNRAANTSMSQFTDAATLANCQTLLTAGTVEWENGTYKIAPGAINKLIGMSPSEMDGVKPFAFGPANPALVQIAEKVREWAQSSIQGPDVLSGESGKSGETARGISARIEQATKQLSVSTGKFAREMLTNVLKKNAYLNALYLPEDELFEMESNLIPTGMVPPFRVGRSMYERSYRIEIRADLRFATQAQRVGEADDCLKLVQSVPQLQQNQAIIYYAIKKCLEARGLRDMIPMLGPAPPVPTTPLGLPPPPPPMPPPGMMGPGGPMAPPPSGMVQPGGPPNGPPPGMPPRPAPPLPGVPQ